VVISRIKAWVPFSKEQKLAILKEARRPGTVATVRSLERRKPIPVALPPKQKIEFLSLVPSYAWEL
jgi:hypothetical protein